MAERSWRSRTGDLTSTLAAIQLTRTGRPRRTGQRLPARCRLIPAKAGFRPATLRHLLTHTAGVRAVRNRLGLLRPALLGPGVLTDPQPRMPGPGAEVAVRRGQLIIRGLIPVPALRRGLRLHPDGDDPHAFRINLPGFGSGSTPVVFSREPGGQVAAPHLGVLPLTFHNRPGIQNPRPWAAGALAAGATALAVSRRHRQKRAR